MKLLNLLGATIAAVLPKVRAPLSEEARYELRRRAEVNARAAAARADRERLFDEVLGGGGRWIPRRVRWLAARREQG